MSASNYLLKTTTTTIPSLINTNNKIRPHNELFIQPPHLSIFSENNNKKLEKNNKDFYDNEEPIYEEIEYYIEEEEEDKGDFNEKEENKKKEEEEKKIIIKQLINNNNWLAAEGIIETTTTITNKKINKINEEKQLNNERTSSSSDTEILSQLLNRGYDWRVRPPGTNLSLDGDHGPVVVNINMLIRSISKIDDVNMEYSTQLTFREEWVDGRLAYGLPNDLKPDHIILTAGQQIWMPDTFFQNEKQARKHEIDKPNVLIRIHKDGRILYSVRISLVLSCPMYLQYYPMDVQTCLIDMASYAYTDTDIEYRWKEFQPVQLKQGLESSLPSFQLTNVTTGYCTSKTNTGTYSCLRTILKLRRQFSYYLLQLYIPSSMLVIVSWVSFWLDRTAVPARVTLGVTTLLTMTTQTSGINAKLPPVSYSKAIDIWCGACLAFIFSALLEFACVTYISSRMFYKRRRNSRVLARYRGEGRLLSFFNPSSSQRPSICPAYEITPNLLTYKPRLHYSPLTSQQFMDDESEEVWIRKADNTVDSSSPPSLILRQKTLSSSDENIQRIQITTKIGNNDKPEHFNETGTTISISSPSHQKRQNKQNCLLKLGRNLPLIGRFINRLEAEVDPAKRADYISS
ncbi:Ig-like domain-containing protein [Meloidogyne graminicola]|uniref:Ig-like domain-containing protein n=1 Tax=Meloidogyne graminicola TaxID=189291 RepID=A0A8S9ZLG7_9BILA|nr:Ig-like domain-containing protein [Meloidogyne graminicola]